MEEIFNTVLKWVFIVFLAGFIGYFGKHLAKIIIFRFKKKEKEEKKELKATPFSEKIQLKQIEAEVEKARMKAETKKAKKLAKAKKKELKAKKKAKTK